MSIPEQVVECEVLMELGQVAAFSLFTDGFGSWWPKEYSWSGDCLESIGMEGEAGGRCTETGPHGFQCDWGRVLAWEPPARLVMSWQISPRREPQPDPAQASIVTVEFEQVEENRTRVRLTHAGMSRHGQGWEDYQAAMGSEYGWPLILEKFSKVAGETGGQP